MKQPKIVMMGGGSYNWSPGLLMDMILTPELENAEYRILDLSRENAETIATVGRRYASEWQLPATFIPTQDSDAALDGADFVVVTISTGGLGAMEPDLKIPEKYGIYQTVGDSVGPGGWARTIRNVPVFAKLAEDAKRLCPQAVLLNYTNPMASLTKVLALLTPQPSVGLCHGLFSVHQFLRTVFGLKDDSEISMRYGGINHFFWVLDFQIKGKPGYPMLRRRLTGGKSFDDLVRAAMIDPAGHLSRTRRVADEFFREYGYLTYMADRHTCEFVSRFLTPTPDRLAPYGIPRTSVADRKAKLAQKARQVKDLASGKTPLTKSRSRETAADIIAARVGGRTFVDIMNLPNVGQIPNLPMGTVVETTGVVNGLGFAPVHLGPLPEQLATMTHPHAVNADLTVEAALEGDWEKAYHALINDPLCSHLTVGQVKKMGRELLEANRKLLPQFFGRRSR